MVVKDYLDMTKNSSMIRFFSSLFLPHECDVELVVEILMEAKWYCCLTDDKTVVPFLYSQWCNINGYLFIVH